MADQYAEYVHAIAKALKGQTRSDVGIITLAEHIIVALTQAGYEIHPVLFNESRHDQDFLSKSEARRLKTIKGKDWWIDKEAISNGIGPICFFCKKLIDGGPRDHLENCPIQNIYIEADKKESE